MATSVTGRWRFLPEAVEAGIDYNGLYAEVSAVLLATFATVHSLALQQTLFAMGKAAIEARPEIAEVRFAMPNKHHFLYDLAPFGLENPDEVFYAADRPYGLIEGTITRDGAAPAPGAWLDLPAFVWSRSPLAAGARSPYRETATGAPRQRVKPAVSTCGCSLAVDAVRGRCAASDSACGSEATFHHEPGGGVRLPGPGQSFPSGSPSAGILDTSTGIAVADLLGRELVRQHLRRDEPRALGLRMHECGRGRAAHRVGRADRRIAERAPRASARSSAAGSAGSR